MRATNDIDVDGAETLDTIFQCDKLVEKIACLVIIYFFGISTPQLAHACRTDRNCVSDVIIGSLLALKIDAE